MFSSKKKKKKKRIFVAFCNEFLQHLFFSHVYLVFIDIFSGSQTGFTNANYKFLQASKYCYFVLILDLPRYSRQARMPLTCQGIQGRLEHLYCKSVFIVFSLPESHIPDANLILAPLRVTHLPLQAAFRILFVTRF